MLLDTHVSELGRAVPYRSCIVVHGLGGHGDGWVVIGLAFLKLYLLVADGFIHSGGVDESVLGAVAFSHNGDDGQYIAVGMTCFLGLETDGVVDGLVACYLVCGNVHETDGFAGGDDRGHLLIDGEQFHLLIGLLGKSGSRKGDA